jgi:hypothetical protein
MLVSVKLNSSTHVRANLVLHDHGILAHATGVTEHYSLCHKYLFVRVLSVRIVCSC